MSDIDDPARIAGYVSRQLDNILPESEEEPTRLPIDVAKRALERSRRCIAPVLASRGFNHLISGHYATFLYYLSSECARAADVLTATRLFLLNKALNGIDLFYEVPMPEVFLIGHTVGMVFAKAEYANHCVFHQGCTVGRSGSDRPVLGEGVILYPQSSVIGRCFVRPHTVLTPGVQLVNLDTPGHCLVFNGKSGRPVFKEAKEIYAAKYFHWPPTAGSSDGGASKA